LADDFLRDYRINKRKSLNRAELSVRHLRDHFERCKVPNISTTMVNKHIEKRLDSEAAHGTVNREPSIKRMLNMGAKQTPPEGEPCTLYKDASGK